MYTVHTHRHTKKEEKMKLLSKSWFIITLEYHSRLTTNNNKLQVKMNPCCCLQYNTRSFHTVKGGKGYHNIII